MSSVSRVLVVSIHDVSPPTWERVETLLRVLAEQRIRACSLLIIPNYRGAHPIERDGAFAAWLRGLPQATTEFVLHGYTHTAERLPTGLWSGLIARHYTDREGEFYDCSREEAAGRIEQGLEAFARCGLTTTGFIAPAWLLGRPAREAARAAGLRYTALLRHVVCLADDRAVVAPTCVYSVRAAWRRVMSRRYNSALAAWTRRAPVVRFSLHPVDADHPSILAHALGLLCSLARDREALTYRELMERVFP